MIRVSLPSKAKYWPLNELPAKVEKNLVKGKWRDRLIWDEQGKKISFTGFMTYSDFQELLSYNTDEAYCHAIYELYKLCNQLEGSVVRPYSARAIIQREKIKKLIGPKGSNINGIRSLTSASIRIDDERGLVIIEADTPEQIDTTIEKIHESMGVSLSFQPTEPNQPQSFKGKSAGDLKDDLVTDQIKISVEKIGKLIGSGGRTINALMEETQTRIEIENETGTVTIVGFTQNQVERAKKQIEELTSVYLIVAQIDKAQIGMVIGKGGQTINGLKERNNVDITIDQNTAIISIEGKSVVSIEAALREIEDNLANYQVSVKVPVSSLGVLFGKAGLTIQGIRENTGTRIEIDKTTGVVRIIGKTSRNVEDARQQICDTVRILNPKTPFSGQGKPIILSQSSPPAKAKAKKPRK
jgi:polyribonucleotide nucleotidyltransferase